MSWLVLFALAADASARSGTPYIDTPYIETPYIETPYSETPHASESHTGGASYAQSRTERYVPATNTTLLPTGWRSLAANAGAARAAFVARGVWLVERAESTARLLCCDNASNLSPSDCRVLRTDLMASSVVAVAQGGPEGAPVLALVMGSSPPKRNTASAGVPMADPPALLAHCADACACSWVAIPSEHPLGRVNDAAIGEAAVPLSMTTERQPPEQRLGRSAERPLAAYIASETGLYTVSLVNITQALPPTDVPPSTSALGGSAPMDGIAPMLRRVAGVPVAAYVAVAASPPATAGRVRVGALLAADEASALWFWEAGPLAAGEEGWRHEWTRGLSGAVPPTSLALAADGTLWMGAEDGLYALDGSTGVLRRLQASEGLPAQRISRLAASGRAVWLATAAGAALHRSTASESAAAADAWWAGWRWFSGPRWLAARSGAAAALVAVSAKGGEQAAAALLTSADGSVAHVWMDEHATLAAKESTIRAALPRHLHHGLNARVPLDRFGDVSSAAAVEDDNHGLWTAWRLAAETLKYSANRATDSDAAAAIRRTFGALRRLYNVTGVQGLPARSLVAPGEPMRPTHWGYNPSPTLKGWHFVGNTSSDELTGHLFAYPLMLLLAPGALSAAERAAAEGLIAATMGRLLRDGLVLLDADEQTPTRWGNWAPASLNDDPAWLEERGLNSVQMLAFLLAAHRALTTAPALRAELAATFYALVNEHGYARNAINQKIVAPDDLSTSDNVLAFVPLLSMHFSCDEGVPPPDTAAMCASIRPQMHTCLERSYAAVRSHEAALFALVYALHERGSPAATAAAATATRALQRYPLELVEWPHDASVRLDLQPNADLAPSLNWSAVASPREECSVLRWDSSPFIRTAYGDGHHEEDPVHFLLSYWLGRREGLLL